MARLLGAALALLVAAQVVLADDKPAAKEIDIKDVKELNVKGKPAEPVTITSEDELAKAFADADFVAKMKKDIDFKKWDLVYYGWSGSGQDKISFKPSDDGKEVTFTYPPGRTRDLRPHSHLFAVPKGAKVTTRLAP